MHALSHPYLLGGGVVLVVVSLWLRNWASRHDLKDLALDAAWQVAKARGDLTTETELGNRLKGLSAEGSSVGRARMAAGYAVRHTIAQVAALAGLAGLIAGAGLIAAAFYIR